jgi:energy-converting hydrogenase Eha subunit A
MTHTKPTLFLGIAAVLFVVALVLALGQDPWRTSATNNATAIAPNLLAGLTALGFALAGGLSLIAAALASWSRTPPTP